MTFVQGNNDMFPAWSSIGLSREGTSLYTVFYGGQYQNNVEANVFRFFASAGGNLDAGTAIELEGWG
jgi:hypothetical protein